MLKILYKFWPILVPFVLYFLWRKVFRKIRIKKGKPMPKWEGKFFMWTIISTFLIAILMLISVVVFSDSQKGEYHPPEYIDGKIVPGYIESDAK